MDHYEVIGVAADASSETIQHAYHIRAQLLHPDRHHGASQDVIAEAGRAMTRLNEAWEVLREPDRRRAYDQTLRRGTASISSSQGGTSTSTRAKMATRPSPAASPRTRPRPSPRPPRTAPLSKLYVICATCGQITLADVGVSRVSCGHCGAGMKFATCPGCWRTVTYFEAGARIRCRSCRRQFKPLHGAPSSRRANTQAVVIGVLLFALPTFGLAGIITAGDGARGGGFGGNLVGSFVCVCIFVYLVRRVGKG